MRGTEGINVGVDKATRVGTRKVREHESFRTHGGSKHSRHVRSRVTNARRVSVGPVQQSGFVQNELWYEFNNMDSFCRRKPIQLQRRVVSASAPIQWHVA